MMRSEFIDRTGFEPTGDEYREIEAEYMAGDEDKDTFCKRWKRQGGVQRLMRLRANKIEELERRASNAEDYADEIETKLCTRVNKLNDELKAKDEMVAELLRQLNEATETSKEAQRKLDLVKSAFEALGIGGVQ